MHTTSLPTDHDDEKLYLSKFIVACAKDGVDNCVVVSVFGDDYDIFCRPRPTLFLLLG